MRNLKRALSLALASVMLLGMMVVGAGAASYPDVDGEKNVEAISVLNAVGAMIGDENGNFNPDKKVTRNEMAAVVARLLYGADAEDYKGTVPFTDVPEWAVKYVAACYDNGIVNGVSETEYNGDGTITAEQAATMMLRALGYEKITDTGADWAKRAVAQANKISLFKGVTGNATATLTRNDVAQLALNTLKADVVETKVTGTTGTIVSGDVNVTLNGEIEYNPVKVDDEDGEAPKYNDKADGVQQLCEKLYGDDLTFTDGESVKDNFGRPASKWEYDGDEIIKVAKTAKKSYVGQVTAKTLYSDLGLRKTGSTANTVDAANVTVLVDGQTGAGENQVKADIAKDDKNTKFGNDGQTVEAYYDKKDDAGNDAVTIIIVNTYLAIVTDDDVVEDDKDCVEITVYGDGDGAGEYTYETSLYQKGDVLLVNVGYDEDEDEMVIEAILGEPETVSGSVTRIGKDNADLTINKTKYPVAAQFSAADGDVIDGVTAIDASNVTISSDATYTLYLDRNGNILAAVEDENNATTSDVVYVANYEEAGTLKDGKLVYGMYATVVFMDGTYKEVLDGDTYNTAKTENTGDGEAEDGDGEEAPPAYVPEIGTLATLEYDETEDTYELKALADYTEGDLTASAQTKLELKASAKSSKFGGSGADYWLSGKTVYLFVSMKEDDSTKIDKVERFVGGVDFKAASNGKFAYDSKNNVEYVIFTEAYESSASDVIYISNVKAQGKEENGYLYKGYKDGSNKEETYLVSHIDGTKVANENKDSLIAAPGFYEYTMTDKDAMKLTALEDFYTATVESVSSDGMISVVAVPAESDEDTDQQSADDGEGIGPFDASGTKIVDLSDTSKKTPAADADDNTVPADVNDYGRNVTTLSALKTVVEKTDPSYTVTVVFYANDDDEVQALFIKSIAKVTTPEEGEGGDEEGPGQQTQASLSLDKQTATISTSSNTTTLNATFDAGTSGKSVSSWAWSSSKDASATVSGSSNTGTVTWVAQDENPVTITVTATLSDNSTLTATCSVTCQ